MSRNIFKVSLWQHLLHKMHIHLTRRFAPTWDVQVINSSNTDQKGGYVSISQHVYLYSYKCTDIDKKAKHLNCSE